MNAEAESSIRPAFPLIQHVVPQTWQPTGGTSETTTDAETNQTRTGEGGVPVSGVYCFRVPRVTGWLFDVSRLGETVVRS